MQTQRRFIRSPVDVQSGDLVSVPEDPPRAFDVEDAAEVLIEYLPRDTQDRVREATRLQELPLWRLFLGSVMRCAERGEWVTSYQIALWDTKAKPNEPRPCKVCGLPFTSRWPDAENCCSACFFGKGHKDDCPTRG